MPLKSATSPLTVDGDDVILDLPVVCRSAASVRWAAVRLL